MTAPRLLARLLAVLLLHALLACLLLSTALAAEADDTPTVSCGKARGGIPRGYAALHHPAGAQPWVAVLSFRASDTAGIAAQAAGRVQILAASVASSFCPHLSVPRIESEKWGQKNFGLRSAHV